MKILITGSTGLLGQALVNQLARSCELVGVSRHRPSGAEGAPHVVCDLTDAAATERVVREVSPDVVIHTQALSDVDRCELEPKEAERLNVHTVEHLCHALTAQEPLLIAMSTDYVFDGAQGRPYDEEDAPNPLSVYGSTKLAGERIVLRYPRSIVVRPSTLFGPGRMNFCDAIVQRLQHGQPVEAFVDQTTSPTYTEDLAEGIEKLVRAVRGRPLGQMPRLYHMTNAGQAGRVAFAQEVACCLGISDAPIRAIRMADQHRPAPRPPYSALTSRHVAQVIGSGLRPWDEALRAYLRHRRWLT